MNWAGRSPGAVPEDGVDVDGGMDSDGDGQADTVFAERDHELALHTDLDGDGFADQVLLIGADGLAREVAPPEPEDGDGFAAVLAGLLNRMFGLRSPGAGVDP
ncbi:MAG: DUF6802 family protein [Pseudonocardia sp.]